MAADNGKDFLDRMAEASRARAAGLRRFRDEELDRPLFELSLGDFDVIAEIKERSPSAGKLAPPDSDRLERAGCYAEGGAAAVSVLTEPLRFGGDVAHLREVAAVLAGTRTPAMRKDFLVDVSQVLEARVFGASGVLLIAAMLGDEELASLLDCALELGMFVLLEAFDADDLERSGRLLERGTYADAAAADRLLVGVNTRNLRTLDVDVGRLDELAARLPANVRAVAESGIETAADAGRAAGAGYSLALVGTALMRSDDPASLIRSMLAAGRERRG